ncbi:MAG: hypothetical protein IJ815_07335 [Lachnospiraceae bacterium]|nr:hypothetical protein [Lachnospiraceae bacterium]
MKKCPFLLVIVLSVAIVAVYGSLLKFGIVGDKKTASGSDSETDSIEVATAVHVLKTNLAGALGMNVEEQFPGDDFEVPVWTPPGGLSANAAKPEEEVEAVVALDADGEYQDPEVIAKDIASDEEYRNNPNGFVRSEEDGASAKSYGEFITVGDDYFEAGDAAFIGDSRMQGFGMYSGLNNLNMFADKGYAIYSVFTKPVFQTMTGKVTLLQEMELNAGKYKKIYVMFGINEMGWSSEDKFNQCYYQLLDMIKYYQPDAVIYVQSVLHVTKEKALSAPKFSNENIDRRNAAIKQIAEDEHVCYLDLNSVYNDEEGYLPSECTSDGIHIKADYMQVWVDYLKTHAVEIVETPAEAENVEQ